MTGQQLKNSILQLAVQGKLVPQDEKDEPASELLKRIKAEKEQLIKDKVIKKEKALIEIKEDELPFDIPESWEWVRLKEIVYNRGQMKPNCNFCYIDIGSINNKDQKLNINDNIITSDKAPSRARKIVDLGDIIYATVRPYLHNMCIIDRPFSSKPIASTGFAVMTCLKGIFNKFLFYFLLCPTFDNYTNHTDNSKGVAYPAINDYRLYKATIPIPPLAEQHRIVEKIEELLPLIEEYDKSNTELEKLNKDFPQQIKKSILQWAVQGKLVEQISTDEPASDLLQRIKAEKDQLIKDKVIKKEKTLPKIEPDKLPFDIPSSWGWCRLGEILIKLTDGTHHTPNYTNNGIHFISVKDISSGKISFENTKFIAKEEHEILFKRCNPEKGDIILSKVGTTGIPVLVDTEIEFSLFVSVALLKFNKQYVNAEYLIEMIKAPTVQQQCNRNTKGVGNKNWVMRDIANTLICIPPLAEQKRIVDKIESVFSVVDGLI